MESKSGTHSRSKHSSNLVSLNKYLDQMLDTPEKSRPSLGS
jgi:hypothetical protein